VESRCLEASQNGRMSCCSWLPAVPGPKQGALSSENGCDCFNFDELILVSQDLSGTASPIDGIFVELHAGWWGFCPQSVTVTRSQSP